MIYFSQSAHLMQLAASLLDVELVYFPCYSLFLFSSLKQRLCVLYYATYGYYQLFLYFELRRCTRRRAWALKWLLRYGKYPESNTRWPYICVVYINIYIYALYAHLGGLFVWCTNYSERTKTKNVVNYSMRYIVGICFKVGLSIEEITQWMTKVGDYIVYRYMFYLMKKEASFGRYRYLTSSTIIVFIICYIYIEHINCIVASLLCIFVLTLTYRFVVLFSVISTHIYTCIAAKYIYTINSTHMYIYRFLSDSGR